MIRQDRIQHQDIVSSPAAALFARKGEAAPAGGRRAPRRVITMRPFVNTQDAPVTPPMPANSSAPVPITRPRETRPDAVVAAFAPAAGPSASAAKLHAAPRATAASRERSALTVRGPVRATAPCRRSATKRTTLRLDAAMQARLARFSASETLSVQALLTRALLRRLPAISIERSTATSLRLPRIVAGTSRSVRFDPHLYWRLKTAAANRRRSMQSIMIAALDAYLSELEAGGRTAAPLSVVA